MSKSVKGGILLIIAGVFLLFNQWGLIPGQAFLFMLAFGFIAAYVLLGARKEYGNVGFLIPGAILFSLAAYAAASGIPGSDVSPAFFFLGLSLSFFAVLIVHTMWFTDLDHGKRFWPFYPAAGLLIFAGIVGLATTGRWIDRMGLLNYLWIIALIVVGAWLVIKSLKQDKQKKS